jgi:CobQ-like glutamine amidotransferase family enzyme
MAESVEKTLYVMRPPNGPVFLVYNKALAELLLSKVNAKFNQDIKLEIHERKETDHRRTSD